MSELYSYIAISWHVSYALAVLWAYLFNPRPLPYLLVIGLYLPMNYWWMGTIQSWKTFAVVSLLFLPKLIGRRSPAILPLSFLGAVGLSIASGLIQPLQGANDLYEPGAVLKMLGGAVLFAALYLSVPNVFAGCRNSERLISLLAFTAKVGIALAAYSILQQVLYRTIDFRQVIPYANDRFGFAAAYLGGTLVYRSAGIFVEPKILCIQLALAAFAVNVIPWSLSRRLLALFVLCAGTVATFSTGGILAFVTLIAILLPFVRLESLGATAKRRVFQAAVAVLVLSCTAVVAEYRFGENESVLRSAIVERTLGRLQTDTLETDLLVHWWDSNTNTTRLLGSGYATYTFAVAEASSTAGAAGYFTNSGGIRLLVETGLIGLATWLLWAVLLLRWSRSAHGAFGVRLIRTASAAAIYSLIIDCQITVVFLGLAWAWLSVSRYMEHAHSSYPPWRRRYQMNPIAVPPSLTA